MFTLLIVDDEPSTRNGLAECFDWPSHGISHVYAAQDGEEALALFDDVRPDIVLTDIKMPGMDGIQLAERLRRTGEVKIIFISGHDDVAYMKSALKVDAIDYILKPINMREFAGVIDKTVRQIKEERNRSKLMADMNARLSQSLPLLREKFWIRAIRDGLESSENLHEQLAFLDIRLPQAGKFCVFVISIDDWPTVSESMSERDRQLLSFALLNITQEIVERNRQGYAFEHLPGQFVCVLALSSEADEDGLFVLLDEIRQTIAELLKLSVTIGIGRPVAGLRQLPVSFGSAVEAVNQKFLLGKNRVIMIDHLHADAEPYFKLLPQQTAQLASYVRAGNAEQTRELLDRLFEDLKARPQSTLRHFQLVCLQLLLIGTNVLTELNLNGNGKDPSMDEHELWTELFKLETAAEMHDFLQGYFEKVCGKIKAKRSEQSRSVIEEIRRIILERYADPNLTIQSIADRIYLTSTYVSLIFKQETGQTINEYLTGVRMEQAKRMLLNSKAKLYEICQAVGYTDASYFTKQFKKYTGLTPKEFREKPI
jgi:two-component system response regulator YesN